MRNRGYLLLGAVAVSLSTLATTSLVSAQSATDATNNPAAAPNSPRANAAVPSLQASSKPAPPPPPGLVYSPVKVKVDGFFSWAILDRLSGEINGSKNLAATNSAESMIKIWIVSDFLRQSAQRNELPSARRLGLVGMDERVAQLGGTLTIESAPESGTSVFVHIPLSDAVQGESNE